MSFVLVKDSKSWVLHELLVEFLELLQRVLVVLTGALRQDVHAEVRVGHLLLVLLLVVGRELVALPLQFLLRTTNEIAFQRLQKGIQIQIDESPHLRKLAPRSSARCPDDAR